MELADSARCVRSVLFAAFVAVLIQGCATKPDPYEALGPDDRALMASATQTALEKSPTGSSYNWTNKKTGVLGTITPTRTFTARNGRDCRYYQQTFTVDGATRAGNGTACRTPTGVWETTALDYGPAPYRGGYHDPYYYHPYPYRYYSHSLHFGHHHHHRYRHRHGSSLGIHFGTRF